MDQGLEGGEGRDDEGFGGNREAILDSTKRPYILGHLSISFLLDPWENLLYVIFGSQETQEKRLSMETTFTAVLLGKASHT